MAPLAVLLLLTFQMRGTDLVEAAQTATAGLVTLIPEGLVLLMSVTFAVAAVRLARNDTLVQQMSATESLAAVDTICVDKTGTLTDGELRLLGIEVADGVDPGEAQAALGSFAASAGDRNRTLETIAEALPGRGRRGSAAKCPSPRSGSGAGCDWAATSYVLGAPDVLAATGALQSAARAGPQAGGGDGGRAPRRRLRRGERTAAGRPCRAAPQRRRRSAGARPAGSPPLLRLWRWSCWRRRCGADAAETIAFIREEGVDLKLISGDARATVTAVAYAVGVPADAGVIEGSDLPEDPEGLAEAAQRNTIFCRIAPEQKRALVEALRASGRYTAMIGDGVNDVPALKQARLAVAMGSGAQVTKGVADVVLLKDEFARLPEAVAEGRRIARNIHRLGRLYLTKSRLRGGADPARRGTGLRLPLPSPPPDPGRLPDDRHPLLRAGAGPLRRAALPGPPAARAGRLRGAGRPGDGARLDPLLLPRRHRLRRLAGGGPHRRDDDPDRARPQPSCCCWSAARAASTSRSRATCWRWSPASAPSSR